MSTWRNSLISTYQSLRANGPFKTFKYLLTLDQTRVGKHVGTDYLGNEYYENRDDIVLRDRWVLFKKWNYDATQVPPEWHQWLHKITDDVPSEKTLPKQFFVTPSVENVTGSRGAFRTYNTTTPKINPWNGGVKQREG
ncbi:hypothetical protein HK097_011626 [Rhizophlyctis rosea]|uniref:NADH dehydrogenase [ubiquinone] 1 alpha subcomplex subunit n=1 Tax=Rhizophlyctis rosea TaxID=64517 RepID=A0AAD5SGT0_9FUNG|nr:hypothetical protein HK097_011626 [Rhizophlyctis rosea]